MRGDGGDQEVAVAVQVDPGAGGSEPDRGGHRGAFVAAGGQPGGLAGGVDAAHLHRDSADTGQAQHQHDDERGDAQRRLNGARAGTAGYTLVLSARPMMLVSADTMESPVTTAYSTAPNAAAAMVPMAYSIVDVYTSLHISA